MRDAKPEPILDVRDLLGETVEAVGERYGAADVDRALGEDRWMVWKGSGWSLRLRIRPSGVGGSSRVRSWTVTHEVGFETLEAALNALELPQPAGDVVTGPLRLPLVDARSGRTHSLTATERDGRIRSVTGFDEPPEWESADPR